MTRPPGDTRPALLTFAGTGSTMWASYPADVARRVEDDWYWQPVFYPAATWPMGRSVAAGVTEGIRLVNSLPGKIAVAGFSQGAICASRILNEFRTGALRQRAADLIAGVTFGNPMREQGHTFPGGADPGGRGIADKQLTDTPDWWHDYADPGDIYANVPNDDVGEDMTAIYRLVMASSVLDFIGPDSLAEQVLELLQGPLREFPAAVAAIVRGLIFVGSKPATAPHIQYHLREAVPGVTHFDHAVGFLRGAAA